MTFSAFSIKMEVIITPDFGELYKSHKKETMTEEKRWKILERVTTGWHLIANNADELTKEECDKMLKELIAVVAMANETNRLVESYQVEIDSVLK